MLPLYIALTIGQNRRVFRQYVCNAVFATALTTIPNVFLYFNLTALLAVYLDLKVVSFSLTERMGVVYVCMHYVHCIL